MGSALSRRAAPAVTNAVTSSKRAGAVDKLAKLPVGSTIRTDAENAVALEEERQRLEVGDVNLEELSKRDDGLVLNMHHAMAHPGAQIEYQEHLLALEKNDDTMRRLVNQVKQEMHVTDETYAHRKASEVVGAGRLTITAFKRVVSEVQQNRRQPSIVEHLAAQYHVDPVLLRKVTEHCSIPVIRSKFIAGQEAMAAEWQ